MKTIRYRLETPEDIPTIHAVERDAFKREAEADLVDRLREKGAAFLSWVAAEDGEVLGHVLFSPVTIKMDSDEYPALGMGPVAIRPDRQRQGIGSEMIRTALDVIRGTNQPIVVVEGNPKYYSRFGFQDATLTGLTCQFDPPPGCFMVLELQPGALNGRSGRVYYRPEFAEVE
jgi:putative acetyltransferase